MLTAVDGCKDDRLRVEMMTVELAAVRQLEDALSHFKRSTIDLIKEKHRRLLTSFFEPIWRVEARAVAVNAGQADKIAFRHLGSTSLNDGQSHLSGKLVDNLALANAVATTE